MISPKLTFLLSPFTTAIKRKRVSYFGVFWKSFCPSVCLKLFLTLDEKRGSSLMSPQLIAGHKPFTRNTQPFQYMRLSFWGRTFLRTIFGRAYLASSQDHTLRSPNWETASVSQNEQEVYQSVWKFQIKSPTLKHFWLLLTSTIVDWFKPFQLWTVQQMRVANVNSPIQNFRRN